MNGPLVMYVRPSFGTMTALASLGDTFPTSSTARVYIMVWPARSHPNVTSGPHGNHLPDSICEATIAPARSVCWTPSPSIMHSAWDCERLSVAVIPYRPRPTCVSRDTTCNVGGLLSTTNVCVATELSCAGLTENTYSPSGRSRYSAGEEQSVHCPLTACPSRTTSSIHWKAKLEEEPSAPIPNSKDTTSLFVTAGGPFVMTALTTGHSS